LDLGKNGPEKGDWRPVPASQPTISLGHHSYKDVDYYESVGKITTTRPLSDWFRFLVRKSVNI